MSTMEVSEEQQPKPKKLCNMKTVVVCVIGVVILIIIIAASTSGDEVFSNEEIEQAFLGPSY